MKRLRALIFLSVTLLLSTAAAQKLAPIPPLQARVTDLAGMLKPEQQAALEKTLQAHEAKTGNQVAVLLVKSTAPEVIEQYGIRVADAWKLGRKGIDDGVILIIAKDNPSDLRRMRLEVGRGAEGVITDAMSKRILQDVIAPYFRQNDFYGGLNAGVVAIHALLNKEPFPAVAQKTQKSSTGVWLPFLIFGLLVIIAIVRSINQRRSFGSNDWGRSSGVIIGGGLGSGLGGWGDSGGGSDSGGFSGGGGDFGGGGASGDW